MLANQQKTYIHLLSADTRCRLDDLPRAIANRNRWQEIIKIHDDESKENHGYIQESLQHLNLNGVSDLTDQIKHSIPKHNMLVIGGDMNAQIGKNGNNKYSLHNTSNRNGQHLTDFMIENRLACLNTNYQKREGKLWTYTYANNTKAQIDYVLINKKWKNSALNCEAYSSFEGVSTDHRIVTVKIRLSLRKNAKRTATTKHYDWALLNNKDIRDKYVLELRNRFETLQEKTEKSTPNDEY